MTKLPFTRQFTLRHPGMVFHGDFNKDGKKIVTGGGAGHGRSQARLWSTATGKPLSPWIIAPHDTMQDVGFVPDGRKFFTLDKNGELRIFDVADPHVHVIHIKHGRALGVVFDSPGDVVCTFGENNQAKLWDTKSGTPIGLPLIHRRGARKARFSPDGSRLAVCLGASVALWRLRPGMRRCTLLQHRLRVTALCFSPRGKTLVTGSDDRIVRLWDGRTGAFIRDLFHAGGWIYDLVFDGSGKQVVACTETSYRGPTWSGEARAWAISSSKKVGNPCKHSATVTSVQYSPDGKSLLTAGQDNCAKLWDCMSWQLLQTFLHRGPVYRARFSPDGERILTVSTDRRAIIWARR